MKKVLLTGSALLAFAAAGFAQINTTTTVQNGTRQTAQQQTGNYLTSTISQDQTDRSNVGSFAATRQESTGQAGNMASVRQDVGSKGNRGYVTQVGGTGNVGSITQSNGSGSGSLQVTDGTSSADVRAAGGNWGGLYQQGSNNKDVSINQSNVASKNFAEITQYANSSKATSIEQSTNSVNNEARIAQGTAEKAVTGVAARIQQSGISQNNMAMITQLGDNNTGLVTQNDGSLNNTANVTQSGTYGRATVNQGQDANFNSATIKQDTKGFYGGKSNTAAIDQSNLSGQNTATIEQHGIYDVASINQGSKAVGNEATIQQQGYASNATINQYNVTNSSAKITQDLATQSGGIDVAEIQQGSSSMAPSNNNKATITQEYSYNTAKLRQYGNDNTATLSQEVGDKNVIKGIGTDANGQYALQQGNGNALTVSQDSGKSNYVPNVANVSQIGNGNTTTVMQMGRN